MVLQNASTDLVVRRYRTLVPTGSSWYWCLWTARYHTLSFYAFAMRCPVRWNPPTLSSYGPAMRCAVLTEAMLLRIGYAVCGTDLGHKRYAPRTRGLRNGCALCGTDLGHVPYAAMQYVVLA
eukprot:3272580-Rhodomonas_salina.2